MQLTNARVLITGGAGLIGSHIADLLIHEGVADIILLDNLTRGSRENVASALKRSSVSLVEGDIRDRGLLASLMRNVDVVFHQAAIRITHGRDLQRA
jgi:UDP-glucose 4-epimerase